MCNKSESLKELASALVKFQLEVNNPKNSAKNPQFNSKYAPLDVVINTVKPILGKFGLAFTQSTGSADDKIIIKTMLMHESGEWLESEPLILPAYQLKKGGEKEFNAQGAGSAITYGRRYSLSAMLGISSEDDDDGNVASSSYHEPQKPQPVPNRNTAPPPDDDLAAIEAASKANVEAAKYITEGQVKMLWGKAFSAGYKGKEKELFDLASQLLSYTITKFEEVQKKDITTLAKQLDKQKSA
jgi:hypothetical protein